MIILRLMVFYAACIMVLSLMWSNDLIFPIHILMKIVIFLNICFFISSIYIITKACYSISLSSNFLLLFLIYIFFVDCFSLFVGFYNEYYSKAINDFYMLINGPLLAYATLLIRMDSNSINIFIKKLSDVSFLFLIITVIIMQTESVLSIEHYPAIASNLALVPLVYNYKNKKYIKFFITFIFILLSGKRSVFIIILFLLPIIIFLRYNVGFKKIIFGSLVIFFMSICGILSVFAYIENDLDALPIGKNIISKISLMNPLSPNFNIKSALGERYEEVEQSIEASDKNYLSFWIGSGNGFTYELHVPRKQFYNKENHSVHFAPVDYYTKYGIVFVTMITITMVVYLKYLIRYINVDHVGLRIFILYQFFSIINSLIGANFGLDYFFWISMALSIRIIDNIKKEKGCVV